MTTDLPPQIQNIPPKPSYAEIISYDPNQNIVCAGSSESLPRRSFPDPEHFGGYLTSSGGTSLVSLASGARQVENMEFIPWEGKIPSVIIQLDYLSHLLEIKPELRITSQNSNV